MTSKLERKPQKPQLGHLFAGRTVWGRDIILDATDEKNWIRLALSETNARLMNLAGDELERVVSIASTLMGQLARPIHYGSNRPGFYSYEGVPLVPEPGFTYFDLWQYGITGEDGLAGFLKICALPAKTSQRLILIAAGLLLVDSAVALTGNDAVGRAAFALHQAKDCEQEARVMGWAGLSPTDGQAAIQEHLANHGRKAGLVSGHSRRNNARAKPGEVKAAREELVAKGVGVRDVAARLALKFDVTPDTIRRVLKKADVN